VGGEGGEYETLTLDCPLFRRGRIVVDAWEVVVAVADALAPVAWMRVGAFHVEAKGTGNEGGEGGKGGEGGEGGGIGEVIQVPDAYGCGGDEAEAEAEEEGGASHEVGRYQVSCSSQSRGATTFHGHCGKASEFDALLRSLKGQMSTRYVLVARVAARRQDGKTARRQDGDPSTPHRCSLVVAHRRGVCMDTDCVFVTLFVDDMTRFGEVNAVYARHFPPVNPPPRATLQKVGDGVSIQVQCSASKPRSVLHVQSLSRWAPSCIGPYSQAVSCGGLVRFSGQIALQPETSTVACAAGGLDAEVARVKLTCDLLGEAMKIDWASTVLWSVLYVSEPFPGDVLRRLLQRDDSDDNEEYVEEYLAATKNDACRVRPEAMTLVVECPCLPRNARIEIQSVHAGIESLRYVEPDSTSDDEEIASQAAVRARAEYGWLRHLTYSAEDGPLCVRAVYAQGKFAKVHLASSYPAVEANGCDIADALAPVLEAARLTRDSLAAANGYAAACGRQDQRDADGRRALEELLMEALGVPAFVVEVNGVGLLEGRSDHWAVECFFVAS